MDYWFWILPIVYFIVTAIGGVAQKKAQEMKQRESARRARTTMEPMGEEMAPDPTPAPPPVEPTAANQRSADEIAAEIRRMMGLPEPEGPIARPATSAEVDEWVGDDDEWAEPAPSRPEPVNPDDERRRDHGGNLREQMAAKDAARTSGYEQQHLERKKSSLIGRHITSEEVGRAVATTRPKRSYLDLSDFARAFVMAEVLGPPKALRKDEF